VELAEPGEARRAEGGTAAGVPAGADDQRACNGNGGTHVEPSSATGADPAASSDKIEITLPDGTSVKVGHDIDVVALRRVMSVLRR
jgi:hypothetical protein